MYDYARLKIFIIDIVSIFLECSNKVVVVIKHFTIEAQ